jgi:RNA polymerase sigma-70 factor (ECF subfamily)
LRPPGGDAKLRRVSGRLPSPERDALAGWLAARWVEARRLWTSEVLGEATFLDHLLGKLSAGGKWPTDPAEAADRLRLPELYLACACAHGDAGAMARFEELYFSEVDAAYRRFDALPISRDEAKQRMREKLFLASPPALLGYAGHGDLKGWLRAATLHALLNAATRETREQPTDDRFFDAVIDAGASAEAAYLKRACRSEFEGAFRAAMERMNDRQRALLRYAFTDGMNVDQIGAAFRVHRATAARWVAQARTQLVDETRAELVARLQISQGDAESIMRAALSSASGSLIAKLG